MLQAFQTVDAVVKHPAGYFSQSASELLAQVAARAVEAGRLEVAATLCVEDEQALLGGPREVIRALREGDAELALGLLKEHAVLGSMVGVTHGNDLVTRAPRLFDEAAKVARRRVEKGSKAHGDLQILALHTLLEGREAEARQHLNTLLREMSPSRAKRMASSFEKWVEDAHDLTEARRELAGRSLLRHIEYAKVAR
ncbi:hypothetical protein [Archangium minus]|uniref:hypothetical protein n=1 Tax=Archangium minus TaxID=83450 RepID=UPI0037BE2557